MPIGPRRIVPHVLLMPAFQVSNPIEFLVQVKIHNLPGNPYGGILRVFCHLSPCGVFAV